MNTFAYIKILEKSPVSVRAKWLGVLLYNYAGKRGFTGMTHSQLMRGSGMGLRAVIRAINELIEAGLLEKTPGHQGWATVYKPQWPRVSIQETRVSIQESKVSQSVTPLKENTSSASSADADALRLKRLETMKQDGLTWATMETVDAWSYAIKSAKANGMTVEQAIKAMVDAKAKTPQQGYEAAMNALVAGSMDRANED